MLSLLRRHRLYFSFFLFLALVLRLYCAAIFPHYGGDSPIYEALATNLMTARTFSASSSPPLVPTDMRTPGYPLLLALAYLLFGHDNNAVRCVQALLDTFTCLLVLVIVFEIAPERFRNRAAALAFAMAAICPFLAEYTATILTETLATCLTTLALLLSIRALKAGSERYWLFCGIACGLAILVRPDSGLLAAAIGLTLVVTTFRRKRFLQLVSEAAVFALAVTLVLAPWTIRNWITLGKFQPVSTFHAEMPGEFVPLGYMRWVRSWIDNGKYVDQVLWPLEDRKIEFAALPAKAFDSDSERERVGRLLEIYNQGSHMSPELDAQFGAIADERIVRSHLRYYVWVPAKRAVGLWLDTRAELLPVSNLIFPIARQVNEDPIDFTICLWQALLNMSYLAAGLAGLWLMRHQPVGALLFVLVVGIRTAFLSTLENPEPRYVLELYPLLEAFGAIGIVWLEKRFR